MVDVRILVVADATDLPLGRLWAAADKRGRTASAETSGDTARTPLLKPRRENRARGFGPAATTQRRLRFKDPVKQPLGKMGA